MTTDTNEWLMGSSTKSFTFEKVGDVARGDIVSTEMQQQRDFATGEAKTWQDGNPMMQLRVILATDISQSTDPEDDGLRAIYVKGDMQRAVREAVQDSGAKGLEVGGTLAVKYDGNGEPSKRGWNAPKLYKAKYDAPVTKVPDDSEPF